MNDQQHAAKWAYDLINRDNWCILDTETTGLGNDAQICQIAVTDHSGSQLLNSLVKPTCPIPAEATRIHGITNEVVQPASTFDLVFIQLLKAISYRQVVIYNADFDLRMIVQSLNAHGVHLCLKDRRWGQDYSPCWVNGEPIHCAMSFYSAWVNEWNERRQDYRWQRLPGGDHSALGDCIATLEVIKKMAASCQVEGMGNVQNN